FEDDYAEAVHALVKAKVEGGEVTRAEEDQRTGGEVVDLLAALQKSVKAAKKARGEEVDDDADTEEKEPASVTPARRSTKKAAAKKAATKSTAKKSATKKGTAAKSAATKTTKAAAKKTTSKQTASRQTKKSA